MSLFGETIAAIATAPGRGGVAVIRMSGADAFAIAERLTGRPPRVGQVTFARIGRCDRAGGRTILDEGLVLAFKAPKSYTGEDVVEFQCHGGAVTPRRVLEACFAAGARLARRGEFTQRAFLNGRLDYDQAESILDLIDAKTSRAADAALEGLGGHRRRRFRALYEAIVSLGSELEHALDIDEGELPDDFLPNVRARLTQIREDVASALRRAHEGKILRQGALVVLSGPPNVGKSSLMNALLEENRAIVSDVAGTTRDSIEEWLDLDGWPIRLVDTAGLRETTDRVEAEGVRRAEALAASADIRLYLSETATPQAAPADDRTVHVLTKADLADKTAATGGGIRVSVRTGEGLDELKRVLVERLKRASGADADVAETPDAEILRALVEIQVSLASLPAAGEGDLVLVANGVRTAGERLGLSLGETYSNDLLDRLFSRFCVGK